MTKHQARIGVIGAGWWSTTAHIPGLLQNPDAELVAVCDTSHAALERVRMAFGDVHNYRDFQEMLAREALDGVIVAYPIALIMRLPKYASNAVCMSCWKNQ